VATTYGVGPPCPAAGGLSRGAEGRQAHLGGRIPEALGQVGPDLLAKDPDIRPVDVIAVK
jgi:hypothetical protein